MQISAFNSLYLVPISQDISVETIKVYTLKTSESIPNIIKTEAIKNHILKVMTLGWNTFTSKRCKMPEVVAHACVLALRRLRQEDACEFKAILE